MAFSKSIKFAISIFSSILLTASPGQAKQVFSCKEVSNSIVKNSVEDILRPVVKKNPELQKLSQEKLVHKAGQMLMTAPDPSFKSYGFMMLLWYGGKEGRSLAAKGAPHFKTAADKAYLNLALALFAMSTNNPQKVQKGRNTVIALRKTGHITTMTPEMWQQLTVDCKLPK